ncbi:hypothetical protein GCM10009836_17910 [Pseudonocardia ailaonensis]|uniref:Uncharacterized protein n=1 Tax=Pseudonocardia ailaonensis TaxID=367279 RepID=A0ABN2MUN0_9PSEU
MRAGEVFVPKTAEIWRYPSSPPSAEDAWVVRGAAVVGRAAVVLVPVLVECPAGWPAVVGAAAVVVRAGEEEPDPSEGISPPGDARAVAVTSPDAQAATVTAASRLLRDGRMGEVCPLRKVTFTHPL